MNKLEDIIDDLNKTISNAIENFNSSIPTIQKDIYKEIQLLIKTLDLKGDRIVNTVNNIKAIGSLKTKIQKIVFNPDYIDSVNNYISAYNSIAKLQENYFRELSSEETPKKLLQAIKEQNINLTIDSLTESGINANITSGIQDILKRNISGSATYSDLLEQMQNYLTTNDTGSGALEKYAKQITTDSLQQFSRQYGQVISDGLGLGEWFMYVGSNRQTSREFCILLTKKKYIHRSEFSDIINGVIDGVKIDINKKTGVWSGGIPGTNENNLQVNCGGYSCEHSLYSISEDMVPEIIRKKF